MSQCPYCGNHFDEMPDHIPMSFKRRAVFNFIRESGPAGVGVDVLKERFFPDVTGSTIRTTIHYINQKIKPLKINTSGGIVRLLPLE